MTTSDSAARSTAGESIMFALESERTNQAAIVRWTHPRITEDHQQNLEYTAFMCFDCVSLFLLSLLKVSLTYNTVFCMYVFGNMGVLKHKSYQVASAAESNKFSAKYNFFRLKKGEILFNGACKVGRRDTRAAGRRQQGRRCFADFSYSGACTLPVRSYCNLG